MLTAVLQLKCTLKSDLTLPSSAYKITTNACHICSQKINQQLLGKFNFCYISTEVQLTFQLKKRLTCFLKQLSSTLDVFLMKGYTLNYSNLINAAAPYNH